MGEQRISIEAARRIALAAQGFGAPRPAVVSRRHLLQTAGRLSLHQIDSVNVLARAHYLPSFSRLGIYDRGLIDRSAWGARRDRRLFEYWAHEASLLPLELHPLLRWRMQQADSGEVGWRSMRTFARERRSEALHVLDRIRADGPMAASDFENGKGRGGWWEWGEAKRALEWLFWAGHVTTATRRNSFERVYDLPERVIPRAILDLPTPALPTRTGRFWSEPPGRWVSRRPATCATIFGCHRSLPGAQSPSWWKRESCRRLSSKAGGSPPSSIIWHAVLAGSRDKRCSRPSIR